VVSREREFRILGLTLRDIVRSYLSSPVSKLSLLFFIVMVAMSIYSIIALPSNFGNIWNDPNRWRLNPTLAPPVWINIFTGNYYAPQYYVDDYSIRTQEVGNVQYALMSFTLSYNYGNPWRDMYIVVNNPNILGSPSPPALVVTVTRPDGKQISLGPIQLSGTVVSLGFDPRVISQVNQFYNTLSPGFNLPLGSSAVPYLFYTLNDGHLIPLDGDYRFDVALYLFSSNTTVNKGDLAFVFQGSVYGLMGTDYLGRDLWLGLLAGFPIDLAVGLLTAAIVVSIAVMVGIVSGFLGGIVDEILTRVTDFTITLPAFPLLIVLAVLFSWDIWDAVVFLAVLSWGASARVIRSMVFQIRSAQYIDLAISVGAGRWWILRNHVLPQTIPYVLYLVVTNVPGAILTLSAINFLNIAGTEYPTWGNLLAYAQIAGALNTGYWWWVIPPGLLIVFVAVVFILTAIALEPIVNPRLRYG